MSNSIKYLVCVLLPLLFGATTPQQGIKEVLAGFQAQYLDKNVMMNYRIHYITQAGVMEPEEQGVIHITPSTYYTQQADYTSYLGQALELTIDAYQAVIVVDALPNAAQKINQQFPVDSLVEGLIPYHPVLEEEATQWVLSVSSANYDMHYHFQKATYHLTKVAYDLHDDATYQGMEINYTQIKTGTNTPGLHQHYHDFITLSATGIQGQGSYADFRIIDNRTSR